MLGTWAQPDDHAFVGAVTYVIYCSLHNHFVVFFVFFFQSALEPSSPLVQFRGLVTSFPILFNGGRPKASSTRHKRRHSWFCNFALGAWPHSRWCRCYRVHSCQLPWYLAVTDGSFVCAKKTVLDGSQSSKKSLSLWIVFLSVCLRWISTWRWFQSVANGKQWWPMRTIASMTVKRNGKKASLKSSQKEFLQL